MEDRPFLAREFLFYPTRVQVSWFTWYSMGALLRAFRPPLFIYVFAMAQNHSSDLDSLRS